MYKEPATIEVKKPEEEGHEDQPEQDLESPEDLRNRMMSESAQVVDRFKGGCVDDLAQVTARAEKDGLTIAPENGGALEALGGEADLARAQLLAETEIYPPDPEEEINPTQIMQAGQDKLQELRLSGKTEGAFHMALHMLLTKTENGVNVWRGEGEIDMQKVEKILEYIKQTDSQIPDPEDDELPLPVEEVARIPDKFVPATKEREIESPELLSTKEASKKFLVEERKKIAQEIWAERKAQREKISALRTNTEAAIIASENMEASQEDAQYGEIAELQSGEASIFSNRLEVSSDLNEQDVQDEKENISQLIENSEGVALLKTKLREHYEKANEMAKGKYESIQKSVEQTMLRNNVFIVHAMTDRTLFKPVGEEAGYAPIEGGMETDLNVLLSIEPSISASSVAPGVDERGRVSGLINDSVGVLLGGGQIKMAAKGDMWSVPTGLKQRTASDSLHLSGMYVETSSEGIDSLVKKRQGELNTLPNGVREADNAYNEIIVDNPEIAGFYQMADKDESGRYWAHGLGTREKLKELRQLYTDPVEAASGYLKYTEKYNEYTRDINRFKERLSLAKNNGLLHYIMSPERQVFECASINDDGTVNVGREVTPEEIAKGRAGLPPEKRKEIGKKLIEDKVFNNQETIEEAREIVNEL